MNPIPFNKIKEFINGETGNGCELITTEEEFNLEKELRKEGNTRVELKIRCKCGNYFYKNFKTFSNNNHPRKQCTECGIKLRSDAKLNDDFSELIKGLSFKGYRVLKIERESFNNGNRKVIRKYVTMVDKEGYKYKVDSLSVFNFLKGHNSGFDKFHYRTEYAKENIKRWLKINLPYYSLLSEEYKGTRSKLKWKCGENHIFEMNFNKIQRGIRCPVCNESKGERKVRDFLELKNIHYIPQKRFKDLRGIFGGMLSYDFYLPAFNCLIEYQGKFHDGTAYVQNDEGFNMQIQNDEIKRNYAKEKHFSLIEIWYTDFDNVENILETELNQLSKTVSS